MNTENTPKKLAARFLGIYPEMTAVAEETKQGDFERAIHLLQRLLLYKERSNQQNLPKAKTLLEDLKKESAKPRVHSRKEGDLCRDKGLFFYLSESTG